MNTTKLKSDVLMLGWELPPNNTGGLGVACHGLTKSLAGHGVKVAFGMPVQAGAKYKYMKVLKHPLQVNFKSGHFGAYGGDLANGKVGKQQSSSKAVLASMHDEAMRFADMAGSWSAQVAHQVVHAHDWMTYPAAMRAKAISGKPMVAHVHATEFDRTGGRVDSRIAEIEYQGLWQADRVIAVSEFTKSVIRKQYGLPDEKISVVHNGVESNEFAPLALRRLFPSKKIVLYVGRLTYQKGVRYFLEAAARVAQKVDDALFLIVGTGDLHQSLMMESCQLGIGGKVVFAGHLQGERLQQCYQMADAFVMPSVSEPYGIVALEALTFGVPTIISKQSGAAESVQNAFKVDYWNVEQMAQLLEGLLSFPRLAREMGEVGRQEVKGINWDKAAEETMAIYRSVQLD